MEDEYIEVQWTFRSRCLFTYLLGAGKFLIKTMVRLVNDVWRICDCVAVVRREGSFFVFHFEDDVDWNFILSHSPWALEGSLFMFNRWWRPNLSLRKLQIIRSPIWVQVC